MKRQLSQQEIDRYFQRSPNDAQDSTALQSIPFDFRRADRIPKEQIGSLHFLYESFVRSLSSSLTSYLRSYVVGSVVSVEQLPFGDFVETLPQRTCLVYLRMPPFEGHTLIEIGPSLVAPILDLVLGGNGAVEQLDRDLSEVEQDLLEGLFQIMTEVLRTTWKPMVAIDFNVSSIETNPQVAGRFSTSEAVLAISMELRVGENVGMVNLAMPSITLKSMGQRFNQQWSIRKTESPAIETAIKGLLTKYLDVTLECELAAAPISLQDLIDLKPGNVIDLKVPVDTPLDISVNGTRRYKADVFEGRKATVVLR